MSILPSQITAALIIVALPFAAWSNLATHIIPDRASIAIAVAGSVARATSGPAVPGWSVGLSFVLFSLLVAAHARGIVGGGDVKLISATTIGLPPQRSIRVCRFERWRIRRHAQMPYGLAIAAGGIWVLLSNLGS